MNIALFLHEICRNQVPREIENGGENVEINESQRRDQKGLRDWRIFTIDPREATDLDDALSCEKLEDGNYQVGVHIAGVSHFIEHNSELDLEIRKLGTSIYLEDRVIPMSPVELCDNRGTKYPSILGQSSSDIKLDISPPYVEKITC